MAEGFDAGNKTIPAPPVEVAEETRERLVRTLAAVLDGRTPEQIAEYIESGFPPDVDLWLDRPGEREEVNAHLDLLLSVMQSPAGGGA